MTGVIPDYEPMMRRAVSDFWGIRDKQASDQEFRGVRDAGSRGSVTGGQHLNALEKLVRTVLIDAGVDPSAIHRGRAARVPGYYRELKNWDLVVLEQGAIVAVIELKSQVGSFGNNLNNRLEEAIGQVVDFWHAVDRDLLPGLRPWFGYLMIVEDSVNSSKPVRTQSHLVPPDPAFRDKSYVDRYSIAFERLHAERLLDSVAFAISKRGTDKVSYPSPGFSFQHFATTLHNRVREVRSVLG